MLNNYRTAKHIKTVDRAGRFIPPGRWYGDRYPRTLQEAFGDGARLHIDTDRKDKIQVMCGVGLAALVVAVLIVAAKAYL